MQKAYSLRYHESEKVCYGKLNELKNANIYLSIVKAVIVRTVALVKLSAANL